MIPHHHFMEPLVIELIKSVLKPEHLNRIPTVMMMTMLSTMVVNAIEFTCQANPKCLAGRKSLKFHRGCPSY